MKWNDLAKFVFTGFLRNISQMEVWEFLKQLTNPESIIHHGGLLLLLIVIFSENGLVIGFFLPGDSLIFLSGLICASKTELLELDITTLTIAMFCAAICGSLFGYLFGRRVGPPLFERKDSLIFKRKYLDITQAFYQKHGGKTLVLGRFLPIIRTFAPIIAGVIKVPFTTFMFFNLVGGALWITSLSMLGYFLGHNSRGRALCRLHHHWIHWNHHHFAHQNLYQTKAKCSPKKIRNHR